MDRTIFFRKFLLYALLTLTLLISACTPAQLQNTSFVESAGPITKPPDLQSISLLENNKQIIRETFDSVKELQDKLQNYSGSTWVLENEDVKISLGEYVFAKKNRELIYVLNQLKELPSDAALLQDMVTTQLMVNYSKQSGVIVSSEEVRKAIDFQKTALDEADPNNEHDQLIRYIMENRIRISGKTEEDFWNSDELYEAYETSLYNSRLIQSILSDESMKGMDSYYELQERLFNDYQKKHPIQVPDLHELFQQADL
ncbi:hypothetical protein AB4124_03425 [Paenibacillus sp. 2KB_20]|uniref:hypothetical protein n=1 Tax=Paenibacillus TaxID=44249 RepID=UPI003D2C6BA8